MIACVACMIQSGRKEDDTSIQIIVETNFQVRTLYHPFLVLLLFRYGRMRLEYMSCVCVYFFVFFLVCSFSDSLRSPKYFSVTG